MKISSRILATAFIGMASLILSAQNQYNTQSAIIQKAQALAKDYPSLCSVKSLAKSFGGKDIIVLTIGFGDVDNKPGIAVIGGVEGNHNLGKELALGFATTLLKESSLTEIKELLGKVTFYVFPDVSPDATDQFLAKIRYEKNTNSRPVDEDRDFNSDEDPFEDLNNDGYITLFRVSDPSGTFIESEDDKRVMVQADLSKGQKGAFIVYTEGIDNDKDDRFNEDGPGGVSFNRNLTYNYEEFGINAGLHPVSEPETRAVLDFLFDHFNIYATISFGPEDNLGQPMKGSERPGAGQATAQIQAAAQFPAQGSGMGAMTGAPTQGQMRAMMGERRFTSIRPSDEVINKLVSDKYHEITGVKGAPATRPVPGNFMEWSYFHYGRYSFSTPAWWYPVERDKNLEIAFLKFAAENKMDDVFIPWTEIKHPDFPGKKTEVGGIKPFSTINPPADKLDDLISKNYKFITTIAAMHAELEFLDVKVENIGDNIFRLSLKVHNKGIFATVAEAGDMNMLTRIMRISIEPSGNQKLVSGQKVQRMQRLEGDKSVLYSWLISGRGSVKISAGAVNTGLITTTAELK
jgi:hypothetical protein